MWLISLPLIGMLTYFTGLNIMQMYLIGQMTELAKLTLAYHLVRKEKVACQPDGMNDRL